MSFPTSYVLKARCVFPIDATAVENGCVVVRDGQIDHCGIDPGADLETFDLGNVAILPGLVNAHAHLEFSDLAEPLGTPGMSLPNWIRLVLQYRHRDGLTSLDERVARGICEAINCGTTTIGEITTETWSESDDYGNQIEVVAFLELIGRDPERINDALQSASEHLDAAGEANWFGGVSPHAPYTIDLELLARAGNLAVDYEAPLAIHLAESREELQWLEHGEGPIADMLAAHGGPMAKPSSFANLNEILDPIKSNTNVLIIHGNYLDSAALDFISVHAKRMAIVYCPRTHAFFCHDAYPLADRLEKGITVALGTDGRASNPDLSLLAEMRYVAQNHPKVAPARVLELGTVNGARALGREDEIGTLSRGKFANLSVIELPNAEESDPENLVLKSDRPVLATIYRGRPVYSSYDWFTND